MKNLVFIATRYVVVCWGMVKKCESCISLSPNLSKVTVSFEKLNKTDLFNRGWLTWLNEDDKMNLTKSWQRQKANYTV